MTESDWANYVSSRCPQPTLLHPASTSFQRPTGVAPGTWPGTIYRGCGSPQSLREIPPPPDHLRKWLWALGGLVGGLFIARLIAG